MGEEVGEEGVALVTEGAEDGDEEGVGVGGGHDGGCVKGGCGGCVKGDCGEGWWMGFCWGIGLGGGIIYRGGWSGGAEFRDDKGGSLGAFIYTSANVRRIRIVSLVKWRLSLRYSVWEPQQNKA